MSFFSTDFVFDGIPSATHNLFITNLGEGQSYSPSGSSVDIITEPIFRRGKPYFYGATQGREVLSFSCAITSPEEISADNNGIIQKWLFGHLEYKKLQVLQDDLTMSYFNCFLNNPKTLRIGNKIHGYEFEIVCDAPWGWTFPKTLTKSYTVEEASETFLFRNTSDDNDYLYPSMVVTFNVFGGDLTLTNNSDNSREFILTGFSPNEVITIDNDRGIISSDSGLLVMSKFNRQWMRLIQGANSITLLGNISSLVMTYSFARKVA